MLWRVRTSLPDRPGALAALAEQCGHADINILGLQIFPDVGAVTDELVLRTPTDWEPARLTALVEASGGTAVSVLRCTEAALADQPTRYVRAAQTVVDRPRSFPEVVARLFDAASEPPAGADADSDVMELAVGDVQVQLHRSLPFTATEHARGAALAALVSDALARGATVPHPVRRAHADPTYAAEGTTVHALVDGVVVGRARLTEGADGGDGADAWPVELGVEPGWQRRGIGTRLLTEVSRLAGARGADEVLLRTTSDNQAVLPMVLAAGLRGRIRMAGEELTVRVPVRELRPQAGR